MGSRKVVSFVLVLIALLILTPTLMGQNCAEPWNNFVIGTAPAFRSFWFFEILRLIDIRPHTQDKVVFFFNRCVQTDTLTPDDFEIWRNSTITNWTGPCLDLINFSECFPPATWQQLDIDNMLDSTTPFTWGVTEEHQAPPNQCDPDYGDRVMLNFRPSALWSWPAGDTPDIIAYKLILKDSFIDQSGEASSGDHVLYFYMRNRDEDSQSPFIEDTYPAQCTGITNCPEPSGRDTLTTPFPPHYPIDFKMNEPIYNLLIIGADLVKPWYYPIDEAIGLPAYRGGIFDQNRIFISFLKGLPVGVKLSTIVYTDPVNYESDVYGDPDGSTEWWALYSPVTADLYGNRLVYPDFSTSELQEYPLGTALYRENFTGNRGITDPFDLQFRVGPVRITSPDYNAIIPLDSYFSQINIKGETAPDIEEVLISFASWQALSNPSYSLFPEPLSKVEHVTEGSTDKWEVSLSRDGHFVFYWSIGTNNTSQLFRQDLLTGETLHLTNFTVDEAGGFAEGRASVNRDGTRAAFLSSRIMETGQTDPNGELYYWVEGIGLTWVSGLAVGDISNDINYAPFLDPEGWVMVFWSNANYPTMSNPSGENPNDLAQIYSYHYTGKITQYTHKISGSAIVSDPSISVSQLGQEIVFISIEDLDNDPETSYNNSEGYPELFYFPIAWTQIITQLTDSTTPPVINREPKLFLPNLGVIFISNQNFYKNRNADGNEEIFLYSSANPDPIEQVTNTQSPTTFHELAIAKEGEYIDGNCALVFISNLSGSAINYGPGNPSGYDQVFWLKYKRYMNSENLENIYYDYEPYYIQITDVPVSNSVFNPIINNDADLIAFSSNSDLDGSNSDLSQEIFQYQYHGTLYGFSVSLQDVLDAVSVDNPGHPSPLLADGANQGLRATALIGSNEVGFDEIMNHFDDDGDADEDGLPDLWEEAYGLDPADNGDYPDGSPENGWDGDPDGDGLTNHEEFDEGTNPQVPDTDYDGLNDGDEVHTWLTDPLVPDTDCDGLLDGEEVVFYFSDPTNPDSDRDWLLDGEEVFIFGTDPNNADTDGGGRPDGLEVDIGRNPLDPSDDAAGEIAQYNATFETPQCLSLISPCVVPASLIGGRGTMLGGAEPNAPNAFPRFLGYDGDCTDGNYGAYHVHESLDSFTVTDLSGPQFKPGDTVRLDASVWCSSNYTLDSLYVFHSNFASPFPSIKWHHVGTAVCSAAGAQSLSVTFKLGPAIGDQAIRMAFTLDSPVSSCSNLTNYNERDDIVLKAGTTYDSDNDGMPDDWENRYSCVDAQVGDSLADPDLDGLTNFQESQNFTNPCIGDTDGDLIPDQTEAASPCLDPTDPDTDNDGLCDGPTLVMDGATVLCIGGEDLNLNGMVNTGEIDPCDNDSDGDGLRDGDEVNTYGTNPLDRDTDDDGLDDNYEVFNYLTDPTQPDTDYDGLNDGDEVYTYDTDPNNPDTDWDSLSDAEEINYYPGDGTNVYTPGLDPDPREWDTDDGGVGDGLEVNIYFTNPLDPLDDYVSVLDGEIAVYSPTYTAPQCSTGISPCNVPASLINGRDSIIGGTEPNQPNTLANSYCADGTDGRPGFYFPAIESFTVINLSSLEFLPGHNVRLEATVRCYSEYGGALFVFHSDSTSSPSWDLVGWASCPDEDGLRTLSVAFPLGSVIGDQAIRVEFPIAGDYPFEPCWQGDVGGYYFNDRDDLVLRVGAGVDSDEDGLPDWWESNYPLCMQVNTVDNLEDYDSDGLANTQEYLNSTDPCKADIDNDGLNDAEEVLYNTDPYYSDTDFDGLSDGDEVNIYLTDPSLWDSDGDGMDDGWEIYHACLNPIIDDSLNNPDGDNYDNITEYNFYYMDPCVSIECQDGFDNDGDGLVDGYDDPGCINLLDLSELGSNACDDGIDNDLDGLTDYPDDPSCSNLTDTSEVDPVQVGSCDTPGNALKVYVSGNYAYVADFGSGLQIINVSSSTTPNLVATSYLATPYSVYVSGDYAYVARGNYGLDIIDVSNPEFPDNVSNFDTLNTQSVHAIEDYAYVTDHLNGIKIIDISNPAVPILAGSFDTGIAQDIFVRDNYAYVADGDSGLQILDVSNPQLPTWIGEYETSNTNSVYVEGDYAYVTNTLTGLQIINIANPDSPFLVGTYSSLSAPVDVFVSGSFAYVADSGSGLKIINVANPAAPTLAGTYETVYALGVYVRGSYAYLADGYQGLRIISIIGADSDYDGMPDDWESRYGCVDAQVGDSLADPDSDGLTNLQEFQNLTRPCDYDTDDDGLTDGEEVNTYHSDPTGSDGYDTDGDTISDGDEVNNYGSDPTKIDSDGDRISDYDEINIYFSNPASIDSDEDGLDDFAEIIYGTDMNDPDSDHDGMPDGWELFFNLDPLDPSDAGAGNDPDGDYLFNLDEYLAGTNPYQKDSDNDGIDDNLEMPPRNPAIHEEPLIFAIFPPVASEGTTLTIMGHRLGQTPTLFTTVNINGVSAAPLPGSTESILYVEVPPGAASFNYAYPPITITTISYGPSWSSTAPFYPFKVTDPAANEIPELVSAPTDLAEGQTAIGAIMLGDRDAYRIHLTDRSVLNISARAFDALSNQVLEWGIHDPDTYLEVLNDSFNLVASNDNLLPYYSDSMLKQLVLDSGTYTIRVTVPEVEKGNTSRGFYALRYEKILPPFITDVAPAVGLPGDTIVIKGCNFAPALADNEVQLVSGSTVFQANITQASTSSLTVTIPSDLWGGTGIRYHIIVINKASTPILSSEDPQVLDHNHLADFYWLDPQNHLPEHVLGTPYLADGDTAVGILSYGRGHFVFRGDAGQTFLAIETCLNPDGSVNTEGEPRVALFDREGKQVPHHPLDPYIMGQGLFSLPETGDYTFQLGGDCPGLHLYRFSYHQQPPAAADQIYVVSGDNQIIPVVRDGTTVFKPFRVKVMKHPPNQSYSIPVAHAPIVFKTPAKEYLSFTDANGIAVAANLATPRGPIQDRVIAYPAGHPGLKVKFNFVLVEAFSRDDWDGDGLTNDEETTLETDPFNIDTNLDGLLDGYPLADCDQGKDTDCDGLDNFMEQYLGTDPDNPDTDGDLYPDGFEVNNLLNPLVQESSSVEFIPLGFNPGLAQDLNLYVTTRDHTRHLRSRVLVKILNTNFGNWVSRINRPFSAAGSNTKGLDSCNVLVANLNYDALDDYYCDQRSPCKGFWHYLQAASVSDSDTIEFAAILSWDDPISYMEGNRSNGLPLFMGGRLSVRVIWAHGEGLSNQPVTFSVMDPLETVPGSFQNASFSTRWTLETEPFDYPVQHPFATDKREYMTKTFVVYSDRYGFASVYFYFGNTTNTTYQFKAQLASGESVTFSAATGSEEIDGSLDSYYCSSDGRVENDHEFAEFYTTIPLRYYCMNYIDYEDHVDNRWAYFIEPRAGESYPWEIITPDRPDYPYYYPASTGTSGESVTNVFVNWEGPAQVFWGIDNFFVYLEGEQFVNALHVTRLERVARNGSRHDLPQSGGYIMPEDAAAILSVKNDLSYFVGLKLDEDRGPGSYGRDMMKPLPSMHTYEHEEKRNQDKDQIVVYPDFFTSGDEPDEYIFLVAPDPGYGQVSFDLYDFNNLPRSTGYWANLGRCCKSRNCPDSYNGIYNGFVTFIEVGPMLLPYVSLGRGTLTGTAPNDFTIYPLCAGLGFAADVGVENNIICWGAKCLEDLEGSILDWNTIGGSVFLGGAVTFSKTGCATVGLSYGLPSLYWAGCKILTELPF